MNANLRTLVTPLNTAIASTRRKFSQAMTVTFVYAKLDTEKLEEAASLKVSRLVQQFLAHSTNYIWLPCFTKPTKLLV